MNDDKWGQMTEYGKDKYIALLEKKVEEKDAMIDWLATQIQDRCDNVHVCAACNNYYRTDCKHPLDKCHNNNWRKAAEEAVKKHE